MSGKRLSKAEMKAAKAKKRGRWRVLRAIVPAVAIACAIILYFCLPGKERVRIQVGDAVFTVEVAREEAERNNGLSRRDAVAPDGGMLFVFEKPARKGFWMRDTTVPLTLAYLDDKGTVLELHDLEPLDEKPVTPKNPAHYALELPQGAFQRAGVQAGNRLRAISTGSARSPLF